MTAKELVTICRTCADCYECSCEKECFVYHIQFKCYPFHVREYRKYPPEAYSDTEIKIPLWIRLFYKFIL